MPCSIDGKKGYIQLIKAAACLAVVVLHAFFAFQVKFPAGSETYAAVRSIRNLMMFAVPCFVMATGELLLDRSKDITIRKIVGKYLFRMIIALCTFTLINLLFDMIVMKRQTVWADYFRMLISDGSWNHMWYLYLMIAIYLTLPVFRAVAAKSDKVTMRYLLTVLFVFLSVVPMVRVLLPNVEIGLYIPLSTVYPLYLLLGYSVSQRYIRMDLTASLAVFLISSALIAWLTFRSVVTNTVMLTDSYAYPLTVFQALSFYMIFSSRNFSLETLFGKIIDLISNCSFGIYLIHMIILKLIFVYWKTELEPNAFSIMLLFITAMAVFFASLAVTYVLRLIPGVKRIL